MVKAESTNTMVSRRWTRLYIEGQEDLEAGKSNMPVQETRYDEKENHRQSGDTRSSSVGSDLTSLIPMVDIRLDIHNIFPETMEEIRKQGMSS